MNFVKADVTMNTADTVMVHDSKADLAFMITYRYQSFPPRVFCDELELILNNIKAKNCYLIGDVNIDIKDKTSVGDKNCELLNNYGLRCGIDISTRFDEMGESCIDHIF